MMLEQWQKKEGNSRKSHYRYLLRGCIDIESNAQLVGDICKIIADPKCKCLYSIWLVIAYLQRCVFLIQILVIHHWKQEMLQVL